MKGLEKLMTSNHVSISSELQAPDVQCCLKPQPPPLILGMSRGNVGSEDNIDFS